MLSLLPDQLVYGTLQLMPGQTNLDADGESFKAFGETVTQGDLDAEAKRRTQANRDPQSDPSPGAFTPLKPKPGDNGRAMAAQRFGTKP